jgi:general secretion pathway protein G
MIIVAVISVLTLIAMPKFSSMIRKANESGSKGHLGSVRAAIRLYYMDNDQTFPASFDTIRLGGAKYISGSIPLYTGTHPVDETVMDVGSPNPTADPGHWGYVSGGQDAGFFWIQCTHPDSSSKLWSSY